MKREIGSGALSAVIIDAAMPRIERAVHRRLMLSDIAHLRANEARILDMADKLRKKARMVRSEADGIVKKLAAFDREGR